MLATFCRQARSQERNGNDDCLLRSCSSAVADIWVVAMTKRAGEMEENVLGHVKRLKMSSWTTHRRHKWFTGTLTHMGGQTFGQAHFIYIFSHSQDVFLHTHQEVTGTNSTDKTQQHPNIYWSEQQVCLNGKYSSLVQRGNGHSTRIRV